MKYLIHLNSPILHAKEKLYYFIKEILQIIFRSRRSLLVIASFDGNERENVITE